MSIEVSGETKWIAIMVIGVIMAISGCLFGEKYAHEQTAREREKTKQLELQWKMDSINKIKNPC